MTRPVTALRALCASLDIPARAGLAAGVLIVAIVGLADIWFDVDYELAADITLLALAALANAFALLYTARSPWWTHRIGRIYWAKCLVLALVLDQISLAVWWDLEYPGRQYVRFAIYGLGAVVYIPMLVALLREQRKERDR
ncbi:putative phage holin [Gordonia sp. DT219]|uniref:putative phage holin n=1 Tax=Gordonia sp. DT219 TaxID=3416658 RepID=UPI003CF435A7